MHISVRLKTKDLEKNHKMPVKKAIKQEFLLGLKIIQSGEAINGAKMFADNKNRKR